MRNTVVGSYTIFDLPLTNALQGYFLSKVFGESAVSLFGESTPASNNPKVILILPTHGISLWTERRFEVLLNENSMPEITERGVSDYLSWAKERLNGIFFSYNYEAYSLVNNIPQVLVPQIVTRVGGFNLLTRNPSWVRRGYVEEVYACGECISWGQGRSSRKK